MPGNKRKSSFAQPVGKRARPAIGFAVRAAACCRVGLALLMLAGPSAPWAAEAAIDRLFDDLAASRDEGEARDLENRIWEAWFRSGNDEVDALMAQAMERRRWYDFNGAIEVLDRVLAIAPDYAEAWNQRATVYFHQREFEKSLHDIARTLELEPRHFGAMAGRALIRLQQMKPALARQNILEALKLHPYLRERAPFPDL